MSSLFQYLSHCSVLGFGHERHGCTGCLPEDQAVIVGRPFLYFAYGAAVSEVEVDTLTGEHRLRQVDILHDVRRSLNPAIDLVQRQLNCLS